MSLFRSIFFTVSVILLFVGFILQKDSFSTPVAFIATRAILAGAGVAVMLVLTISTFFGRLLEEWEDAGRDSRIGVYTFFGFLIAIIFLIAPAIGELVKVINGIETFDYIPYLYISYLSMILGLAGEAVCEKNYN